MLPKIDYSLYLIIDSYYCTTTLIDLIKAGVTCIQLREKNADKQNIINTAKNLLNLLKPFNVPLIINDHVDVVMEANAHGVHLGQQDGDYIKARQQLGNKKIIGLTIENFYQAQISKMWDVNYFGVGPIFPTPTKLDAPSPIGLNELTSIQQILPRPVVAIGGITQHNARSVLQCGVKGIAVISAILKANDPISATRKLSEIIIHEKI